MLTKHGKSTANTDQTNIISAIYKKNIPIKLD